MGLETAAAVSLAAIAVGATVGKMSAEKEAEQANLSAINRQSKLLTLQYQQKTLKNLDLTDKMLSRQAVQMAARGVAFDSPSFNAIQRETLNIGSRKAANEATEESLGQQALDIERHNVKATLHAQLFGDAATLAFSGLSFAEKFPRSGGGNGGVSKLPQVEDI